MAQSWYSVVDEELASVDESIRKGVRSSYPELNEMCENVLSSSNQVLMPALIILTYYANGGKKAEEAIGNAVCFQASFDGLHLHDSVDSNGNVLPGKKKKLFSKDPSTTKVIVAGDFMYVMGFRYAYASSPKAVPYLMKASETVSNAIFDIVDRSRKPEISEEDVMDIVLRKGAIELEVVMECAAEQSGAGDEARKKMADCGRYIGTAVQIVNDIKDVLGGDGDKPLCHTLMTGYPTLPLYYAMKDSSVGQSIKDAYVNTSLSLKEARMVASQIGSTDAVAKCRETIEECKRKASEIIMTLQDSKYRSALIEFVGTL